MASSAGALPVAETMKSMFVSVVVAVVVVVDVVVEAEDEGERVSVQPCVASYVAAVTVVHVRSSSAPRASRSRRSL